MPSFEIPDGATSVKLKAQTAGGQTFNTGPATFSVTNKSGQSLTGRLSMEPQGNSKAEWFEILGEKERNFAGSETQKITVNVKTPATVPAGDYKARFRVVNVSDPDNDFTESPVVTFTVPAADAPKGGIPWWVWLIVAAVVVAIIVVLAIVFWPSSKVTVPNVSKGDMTYAAASDQLKASALTVAPEIDEPSTAAPPGNVFKQDPAADSSVDKNTEVKLTVAQAPAPPPVITVEVPDVSSQGYSYDHAQGVLEAKGFTASKQVVAAQGKTPGTVVAQNPAALAQVPETQKAVTLSVDPGVTVPDISSAMNLTFQSAFNTLRGAGLEMGSQSCRLDSAHPDKVVGQSPAAGGNPVAKGSTVNVVIGSARPCFGWRPFIFTSPMVVQPLRTVPFEHH